MRPFEQLDIACGPVVILRHDGVEFRHIDQPSPGGKRGRRGTVPINAVLKKEQSQLGHFGTGKYSIVGTGFFRPKGDQASSIIDPDQSAHPAKLPMLTLSLPPAGVTGRWRS